MIYHQTSSCGRAWQRAGAPGLLLAFLAGCGGANGLGPAVTDPAAADSAALRSPDSLAGDSLAGLSGDSAAALGGDSILSTLVPSEYTGATAPGIVFGSYDLALSMLGTVHTGAGRVPGTSAFLSDLALARARGARLIVKLAGGSDSWVKNSDGTFSFTKWKAAVDRFKSHNIGSYITDGTILGHYLIDEPNSTSRWGGKIIPQATLEAMAKYSKQLWPGMATFVRVVPSWLASAPVTYTYLDAGWAQYASRKGDPARWVASEVTAAKSKKLGLMVSMNVIDGGNGSSGVRGTRSGLYNMSASELRNYGTALLNQSYDCGFFMWTYLYGATYYARSGIKSAMADLSAKARSHVKTSCRQ